MAGGPPKVSFDIPISPKKPPQNFYGTEKKIVEFV